MSKRNRFRRTLWRTVKKHIRQPMTHTRQSLRNVSERTVAWRRGILHEMVNHIYDAGYKPERVQNLRTKHLDAVFEAWKRNDNQHNTIQTKLSVIRFLAEILDRPDLIRHINCFAEEESREYRKAVIETGKPRENKAWMSSTEAVVNVLNRIIAKDSLVALQLALQHAFGLRVREAFRLRPAESYQAGCRLELTRGTKGGRPRTVPVETEEQRKLLEHALEVAKLNGGSMMPRDFSEISWRHHYYSVLRNCGFTQRDLGITSHGLRHDYAQKLYQKVSGQDAPVISGTTYVDGEVGRADLVARLEVAEALGHGRYDITRHYLDQIIELDIQRHVGMRRKRGSAWQRQVHVRQST